MMRALQDSSYLYSSNAAFIEELYAQYLRDPGSLSEDWRAFFAGLPPGPAVDHQAIREEFLQLARHAARAAAPVADDRQVAVLQLINAYRFLGHQQADLDPLKLYQQAPSPELNLAYYSLSEADLDVEFSTGSLVGPARATLRQVVQQLRESYCGPIGAEYMHITDTEQKRWIQQRLEGGWVRAEFEPAERRAILERVLAAENFEKYLHTRYVGQKRFSLEGADSLIPMLDTLIQRAGGYGVGEIVLGMAHRGRLNVLTNILGKAPAMLYKEFEGVVESNALGSGDVKYHQGFSSDIRTPGGIVHLALFFNPSHLEIIDPVVEGSTRARQHRRKDRTGNQVLPLLIHGDAAFSGQGVVMETLNMSQARGFKTGGTVHVIVNNQIGFTTSNPLDVRSTTYCTEVARMIQAPIFHVNGDDPEACVRVMQLALDYRNTFHRDVVIDLVCYRRYGHNEADEPTVTQPVMYSRVNSHPRISAVYGERLAQAGVVSGDDINAIVSQYHQALDEGRLVASQIVTEPFEKPYWVNWDPYMTGAWDEPVDTRVPVDQVRDLAERLVRIPDGFVVHSQVERLMRTRMKMAAGEQPADWGFAENLAYATLAVADVPVRLSGQDSGRGTFFHRHAILHNQLSRQEYTPLQHLSDKQGDVVVIDSLLSEEAVLGFEYGYSTAAPYALVIWEAQFGDFANGAQVVIDQFITSGEAKWGRRSGLVMFLPHGYDGQGPEHSSARLERYLQLCAEENIQVCVPSLPAQFFHLLRRQALRTMRKPLVVLMPKSLLRHNLSVSTLADLSERGFRTVIGEIDAVDPGRVRRVVVCTGKVYFDLYQERKARAIDDIALVRVEQLYPFPRDVFAAEIKRYAQAKELIWCQEEPQNQGAWAYMHPLLDEHRRRGQKVLYAGRPASASPAVGYYQKHVEQLQAFLHAALGT